MPDHRGRPASATHGGGWAWREPRVHGDRVVMQMGDVEHVLLQPEARWLATELLAASCAMSVEAIEELLSEALP